MSQSIRRVIKSSYISDYHFQMLRNIDIFAAQKMEFSIKDFFSKYDQIRRFLRIWSHLLKKSLRENFIFCAVINRAKSEKKFLIHSVQRCIQTSMVELFVKIVIKTHSTPSAKYASAARGTVRNWVPLTHFRPMIHFYTPLKTSENQAIEEV